MEEPSQSPTTNVESYHQARHSDGVPADDDGGSDDPPPIPSAGSASKKGNLLLNETLVGARSLESFSTLSPSDYNDPTKAQEWSHTLPFAQVAHLLGTDIVNGLTTGDASSRRERCGRNKLESSGGVTWWRILVRQVSNSLTLVLAIAMALSYGTLDFIEGGVITAVIVLNIVVGFFQDYRAEQTIQSLRALAAPVCRVVRDNGTISSIKAEELVPGDLVQLSVGDIVSADLRLVSSINLATDEALLTGESKPCSKDAECIISNQDSPIGDRVNIAYSSTTVTRGRATGVVIATGMGTEIGKIALLLRDKRGTTEGSLPVKMFKRVLHSFKNALGLIGTPLQVKLSWFALLLFALAILLAIIVFSANRWDIDDETLIYGICVAVAVIPESLIAVLTITMAVGSKAMAKGNVIVRKMGALEAVGGVTNICSDKTGTLTQGKMLARKAFLPDGRTLKVDSEGSPFDPSTGCVTLNGNRLSQNDIAADFDQQRLFNVMTLCNLASVFPPKEDNGLWTATGEPTEIALQVMAMRVEHAKSSVVARDRLQLMTEHSFDSSVKRMSVVYRSSTSDVHVFVKGATEVIVPLLNLNGASSKSILDQADQMASQGLRVLCFAHRSLPSISFEEVSDRSFVERDLTFAGLVGLYDPPRLETASAIQQCQTAGIKVHMLTGDHLKTAETIAKEIGILSPKVEGSSHPTAVMTAQHFDKMSDEELDNLETLPLVLARCSPSTKLRMLHALHRRSKYCVMTGDGVNDSPALKGADVGVAMGLNGSDVSKEAADMVLTDDNFASIVSAIREGRRLFDNIQKFLLHLLISNIAQVILLLIGLAFKDQHGTSVFPLSPLEILFANLITSSFLAIGLGLEEASSDVMTRPPHSLKAGVFTKELIIDKFIYGTFMGCLCLASYIIVAYGVGSGNLGYDCNHSYNDSCDTAYSARGTAYSILTVLLSVMAWEAKHLNRSLFNMYPEEDHSPTSFFRTVTRNRFLFWAVMAGMLTPFPIIYIPVINRIVFRHKPLSWEWGLVVGSLVCFVALVESWKALKRRFKQSGGRSDVERNEKD
ncbi:potassium/sodium eff [Polychaeton citri CBS 116435]|uniref:P-type Na(+) transporter n=1 Tax=Polychaeton citri CBS 116435 TaxID=1314669 RepID=A0A9P4Q4V3_9PEZI|nr:potassium/sodium eff [Polychaeton citri CBS 116435]